MVDLQCCVNCGVQQSESVINIHVTTLFFFTKIKEDIS